MKPSHKHFWSMFESVKNKMKHIWQLSSYCIKVNLVRIWNILYLDVMHGCGKRNSVGFFNIVLDLILDKKEI